MEQARIGPAELAAADQGLTALLEAYEAALEDLRFALPAAQVRALLIIDRTGPLNLRQLAAALAASASAASRLCDWMEAADLVRREPAAASRREIVLAVTEVGRRLADWIRDSRRSVLEEMLVDMPAARRADLASGLAELAAGCPRPRQLTNPATQAWSPRGASSPTGTARCT